jgi:hypothetical protein
LAPIGVNPFLLIVNQRYVMKLIGNGLILDSF